MQNGSGFHLIRFARKEDNEMKKKLSLASVIIQDSCERNEQKWLQKN